MAIVSMSERTSRFGGLDSFVINLLVINFFMSASGPVDGPMKPESEFIGMRSLITLSLLLHFTGTAGTYHNS